MAYHEKCQLLKSNPVLVTRHFQYRVHVVAYDYSRGDWDGLRDHLRDVPWEDIFGLGASAAASEFCKWVQVGIDVYIPHRKYQVKPHSSPWFSADCAAAILMTLILMTLVSLRLFSLLELI